MEQYWMPRKLDFKNLRSCLDNYTAVRIYIRDCGGIRKDRKYHCQGMQKVNIDLAGKTLDFRKDKTGLYMLVDSEEVFHFPLKDYAKGFSLAYERIRPTEDGIGRMVILSTGIDPYDPALPYPKKSFLRIILDSHLMEIFFEGMVNLKFHSWWQVPYWKYWTIDTPGSHSEIALKRQIETTKKNS